MQEVPHVCRLRTRHMSSKGLKTAPQPHLHVGLATGENQSPQNEGENLTGLSTDRKEHLTEANSFTVKALNRAGTEGTVVTWPGPGVWTPTVHTAPHGGRRKLPLEGKNRPGSHSGILCAQC